MKAEDKEAVRGAVGKWRSRLRLMDWSIGYEWESEAVEGKVVVSHTSAAYRRMKLSFAPTFPKLPKDGLLTSEWMTIEKIILHELAHAVIAPLGWEVVDAVQTLRVGEDTERQVLERISNGTEAVTEWVARLLWEAWEGTAWDGESPALGLTGGRVKELEWDGGA